MNADPGAYASRLAGATGGGLAGDSGSAMIGLRKKNCVTWIREPGPSCHPLSLPRLFGVVPAAGHSRRMGRPKLLLPLGSSTVIARMLAVLNASAITATIVVVRALTMNHCARPSPKPGQFPFSHPSRPGKCGRA